ncbi:MAG: hypothetical protein AB4352_07685 [Hormoscilla sp.]
MEESTVDRGVQAKVGLMLAIAGAVLFIGGGGCVFAGILALDSLPPGFAGVALLMEVAGLGLTEKNRD